MANALWLWQQYLSLHMWIVPETTISPSVVAKANISISSVIQCWKRTIPVLLLLILSYNATTLYLKKMGYYQKAGKRNGKLNGKMEWKMEKLYQTHINLMIFTFLLKDTLSVSFNFDGKVQQCLVTGSKWNIFVNKSHLKSTCTQFDIILCSLYVNLQCWTFPALCKH